MDILGKIIVPAYHIASTQSIKMKRKTLCLYRDTPERRLEADPNSLNRITSHGQGVTETCQWLWNDFILNGIEILKKHYITCNHCNLWGLGWGTGGSWEKGIILIQSFPKTLFLGRSKFLPLDPITSIHNLCTNHWNWVSSILSQDRSSMSQCVYHKYEI